MIGGRMTTRVARRPWAIAALALVAAAALLVGDDVVHSVRRALGPAPDSTRYVVLPFAGAGGRVLGPEVARQHLHGALGRWRDLELVALDATDRETNRDAWKPNDRLAVARAVDAGRAVSVQLSRMADSVQLRATLYDGRGAVLGEHVVRVPDAVGPHDGYRRLGAALLRVAPPPVDTDEGDLGTDLLAAWHAYLRGHEARRRWDLDAAEREFRAAAAADPGFVQAQLWAAQVAAWQRPDDPAGWRDAASRATARLDRLTARDGLLARGVHALATERYPEACRAYAELQRLLPRSDVPWYGIAQCHAMDPLVLRDARSPSGWRFRSSHHAAVAAFDSAIALAEGAPAFAFEQVQRLLRVESTAIRTGRSAGPDETSFGAYPSLDADTLAFVPYPERELASGSPSTVPGTFDLALRRDAETLDRLLSAWVERAPESADALEALAVVQEVRGERGADQGAGMVALSTIARARGLGTRPQKQLTLASTQVRLLLKDAQFDEARRLADSILSAIPRADARQAEELAGLAALTGKLDRVTQLMRILAAAPRAVGEGPAAPPAVLDAAAELTSHAILGVCSDSMVLRMEQSVDALLERHVGADARSRVRDAVLARPLSLAVPCAGRPLADRVPYTGSRLMLMQRAYADGQYEAVRAHLDTLMQARHLDRPGDVTMDQTYQEAWLLAAIGDTAAATRHLDLTLTAMATLGTQVLRDPAQAAAVGRAMALRAALASTRGERDVARRWTTSLAALWGTADPPVRRQVEEMRQAAGRP